MTGPLKDVKVIIDNPHGSVGEHVDIITPLPNIPGADKIRIDNEGNIATEDVIIKGGWNKNIIDNTK